MNSINNEVCLNCEQDGQCYECYILSGKEEYDLRKNNATDEELIRFGYEPKKPSLKIEKTFSLIHILLLIPLFLLSINCYPYQITSKGEYFYTKKDLIEIEIMLCDRLPMNNIFSCLMKINK